MSALGRRLGIAAVCFVILVVAIAALLHTPPVRRYALTRVSELLRQQNVTFNTDELSYNLLDLTIRLRNLRIASDDAPDLPPFAEVDRAELDLSMAQLLRRRYVLQGGSLEGVRIHYYVAADGRDNLPRPPQDPDAPSEPLNYLIDQLAVRNARVRYENRVQNVDLLLPVREVQIDGNPVNDRHAVKIEAASGTLRYRDRQLPLDRLVATVDAGEDDVKISAMQVDVERSSIALSGAVDHFDDPTGELSVRGHVDASRAAELAGVADPIAGTIDVDATVKGSLRAPTLAGNIRGSSIGFREFRDIDVTTTAAYDVREKRAAFSNLDLRAPFGRVTGDGTIAAGGSGESSVRATIDGLDAAALMRALDLDYAVLSRVDGRVDGRWPGLEYLKASGNAALTLTPTRSAAARSALPVAGRVNANGMRGRIDAQLAGVRAAGVDVNGRISISENQRLGGAIAARVADVGRTAASFDAFLGRREPLLPARVAGGLDARARLGGSAQAPAIDAVIEADALRVGAASGIALNAALDYSPAAVVVEQLDMQWRQAWASATGRVGLSGARSIALRATASSLDVPELLKAFDKNVPAAGTLSLDANISGTMTAPAGTVTVRGTNLAAFNEALGSLTADVNLANREISASQIVLDKPQPGGAGRLEANGRFQIDRRAYSFAVRSTNVQLLGLTLPNGDAVRGPIELAGTGTGTVEAPAATIDLVAPDLIYDGRQLGRITLNADVASQQATVTTSAERFALDANAVIGVEAPYPAKLDLRVADMQLSSLPLDLRTPLDGRLRATAAAAGNLSNPEQASVDALVDAFTGTWNGHPFSIDTPARLSYAAERLTIERLRLVAQDSELLVTGNLPLADRAGAGAVTLDARANVATLAQYAPAGSGITGAGELTLTGVVRGTMKAIDPELVVTIANGSVASPQLQPAVTHVNVRALIANGVAAIEQLAGRWGTASVSASGRIPLEVVPELPVDIPRKGGPATFSASIADLDPAQLPGTPDGLTGRISVSAEVSAARPELAAIDGRITADRLSVEYNGLTLAQNAPAMIRLAGGMAAVERFALSGSVGNITATGTVGLLAPRPVDLSVAGNLNIAVASLFTDAVRAEGDTRLQVAMRGTAASPELTGFVDLANASFVVDEPDVAAEGVAARLDLAGRRINLTRLDGVLNGGRLDGSGFVLLGDGGIADVSLQLSTDDVALDAPLDLRSLSDAKIQVTRNGNTFVVGGQVTIDEAGLTGDINFDEGLLTAMTARRRIDLTEQRNPLLERVRFNVNVDTASPILVDNNLATAEVTADLRVTGTPYEPGLAGRLTVLEDGEIVLNERRYEVERGVLTFIDERRIYPQFDLLLNTSAGNYDVTVAVSGTPDDTETTLTADPTLPEPDIMALLVTGRTLEEMRGEEFEVAQEQVLSYLTGRVGSQLGRGLERATGLTEVRIEPQLIANEADPSARLTVGQELTDEVTLVYSTSLTDADDQIWVAEYDVTRRFETRAVRQSDNSYRVELRHDMRFGGNPEPRRIPRTRPVVRSISVSSDAPVPEPELRAMLRVEEGKEYDFFRARRGADRIREHLRDAGWLQSRVRVQREGGESGVDVRLTVAAGPRVDLQFDGAVPPQRVIEEIRTQWNRGVFDSQRIDDSNETVTAWLMEDNYLRPKIETTVEDSGPGQRRVVFRIEPGTRFNTVRLAFDGAAGVPPQELDDIVNEQGLERELFTDPAQVTELLERYYYEQGYLIADVAAPVYEYEGALARVVLKVQEGPRFVVRRVSVSGAAVIAPQTLAGELPVVTGDPFLPFAAENALDHIRDQYWRRGYNDVRPDYQLALDREAGHVDVAFLIEEGPQSVIADVVVAGNDETSNRLVREQVELVEGQPLDLSLLARSRRNLYDTGAFSIVDVTREEIPGAANGTQPVRLNVSVREVQPIQLRYGGSYDTERGLGGTFDISDHNTLGKARVIGLRARYDGEIREGRAYFSQPSLRYFQVELTGAVYTFEDRNPPTTLTRRFNVSRRGASIEGETELRNRYVLSYGYRFERARTVDPEPDGLFDELFTVAPLTATLSREARDEVLDATRGSFFSQALEYSPSWLGAERAYVRYLGQYFHYVPLQRVRRERFTNELIRPRFVFATGVRVGVGRGFGNPLPASERFLAGGSTTLRGFAQNAVGPVGENRLPLGGSAMLVLNNEIRFPMVSIVDGVAFTDIGNVFPRVSDFDFAGLRRSAGVGLRVRTAWFLLRGDYGVVLDRREGEPRGRFYFSIGQAF